MNKEWIFLADRTDCGETARRWGVPALVARLLLNRGWAPEAPAADFLSPALRSLHPPSLLSGAEEAAERICAATRRRDPIVLYGDYDVDGTTGLAILWHVLHCAGAVVSTYVPHRIEEGYGLNADAVGRLADGGAKMIVSVDCGITAVEVADQLRARGVSLIITDHHTLHDPLPDADVIVHPSIGEAYPNRDLCGAGVAFKLAWAIAQRLSGGPRAAPPFRDLLRHCLPLAALGTIADVVPLVGENRVIARHGLLDLRHTPFVGLVALIEQAGLGGTHINAYDVGFKLAPRINAAGRMGHARLAVELLTTPDAARAREIVLYLDEHNRHRRTTEQAILRQVCARIDQQRLAADGYRGIALAGEGWHPGVIGIVASRIVDRYHRPTVLIALSNGEGQGSGRSIRGFDLHAALSSCSRHLVAFGGHAMAAGLRIEATRVTDFVQDFVSAANQRLTGFDLVPKLRLDAEVRLSELDLEAVESVGALAPFGIGNPRPRLATDWVTLAAEPRLMGKDGQHLRTTFRENGAHIDAVGFGMGSAIEQLKHHRRCRVAFEPVINEFNGRRSVELHLLDIRFPDS